MEISNSPALPQGRKRRKIRFYPSIWADISRGLDRWQKEEALSDLSDYLLGNENERGQFIYESMRHGAGGLGRLPREQWAELRRAVFARDDYTCHYCQKRGGPLECAHIVPIASGGSNDLSNLVCSCRPCNRAKAARPLADFMATRAAI